MQSIARHTATYTLSILITGSVAFIAIPVMKRMLGPAEFATHNIIFNTMLVANLVLQGWLTQALLRHGHAYLNEQGIIRHLLRLAFIPMLFAVVVNAIIGYVLELPWAVMAFFLPVVAIASLVYVLLAYSQAQMWSHFMLRSDLLRSVIFLLLLFSPILFEFKPTLAWYWGSWLVAYLGSFLLLLVNLSSKNPRAFLHNPLSRTNALGRKLFRFGWPLSIWLGGIFLLSTVDRYFLTLHFDRALLANYFALHEVMVKGMGFLLSPAIMAAYPMLSRQYDTAESKVKTGPMMRKMMGVYALLIAASVIIYILFYPILASILQLPAADIELYYSGLILLLAAGFWQWNVLLHKPLELAQKTPKLLVAIIISTVLCMVLQWLLVPVGFILAASGSFLAGVLLYSLLIIIYLYYEPKVE